MKKSEITFENEEVRMFLKPVTQTLKIREEEETKKIKTSSDLFISIRSFFTFGVITFIFVALFCFALDLKLSLGLYVSLCSALLAVFIDLLASY